jgi:LysR family glycine cleavage system transcriptional activator
MRKLPPLIELRAFEAAARHLSFKAAGEELAVTATAISHQIKFLEDFCGVLLFRRLPRPLTLTEAGERLFPVVRDGLDKFAATVSDIQVGTEKSILTISTTSAFASRWLVPKLAHWRSLHPGERMKLISTDTNLDLQSGECDLVIRYLPTAPTGLVSHELMRDRYIPVCSPALLSNGQLIKSIECLRDKTLIHWNWSSLAAHPPPWQWWLELSQTTSLDIDDINVLSFREELHAIEAVIAGHGIGVFSDALVAHELWTGELVKATDSSIEGWGYYIVYQPDHPRKFLLEEFANWTSTVLSENRELFSKTDPASN